MVTRLGCHNIQISYDGIWFPDKYWILKEFLNKDQTVSQYACILHESPFKCLTEMQGNKVSFQFFKWLFIIYAK